MSIVIQNYLGANYLCKGSIFLQIKFIFMWQVLCEDPVLKKQGNLDMEPDDLYGCSNGEQ